MYKINGQLMYFISSIVIITIGFLCYFLFRDTSNLIFFQIFNLNIWHGYIIKMPDNCISYFIKYNLCDGLWLLSGILFFRFLWFNNKNTGNIYIIIFICIALLHQFLQLIEYIPGTFDIMDILTMAIFALLEQCVYFYTKLRRKKWVKIG